MEGDPRIGSDPVTGRIARINVLPVLLVCLAAAACHASPARAVGELACGGIADNTPGCTDLPANTLDGPVSVAVNPSGNSVYVVDSNSGNVAHFFRGSEGKISYDGSAMTDRAVSAPTSRAARRRCRPPSAWP